MDEVFNLKYDLAGYIFPRLQKFCFLIESAKNQSVPSGLNGDFSIAQLEWIAILQKMKIPFEYLLYPEHFKDLSTEELDKQREEGLVLFSKYFESLWD